MQFGIVLPNYSAWFGANIRRTLATAEELGFDSVWANDHVVFPGDLARLYGNQFLDPLALLPYLAACSDRLLLGTTILVVPYRPPIPTAKMLATIDRLSEGRLRIGVGVGHEPDESEALGLPYRRRGAMTDEFMRIWVKLWTEQRASFDGEFYSFHDVQPLLRPVQEPHPKLLIGGTSEASFRRVAEFGAGWHPGGRSAEALAPAVARLREVCGERGAPFPDDVTVRWSLDVTADEGESGDLSASSVGEIQRLQRSPANVRAEVDAFERLGVTRLALDLPPSHGAILEQMRRFAHAVSM